MGGSSSKSQVCEPVLVSSIMELRRAEAGPGFFDRKDVMLQLLTILSGEPRRVTLVVGPIDSGKSKLLAHLQDVWQSNSIVRHLLSPLLLINMRIADCVTPSGLELAIRSQLYAWHDIAREFLKSASSVGHICGVPLSAVSSSVEKFMASLEQKRARGLTGVLASIQEYITVNSKVRPVLIFDEANIFKTWDGCYEMELEALVHFFLWITKEKAKGHVLLASSDDFFMSWLRKKLELSKVRLMPLGYFRKSVAKRFVLERLATGKCLPHGFDAEWNSIHEVTGGSPQLLGTIVDDAAQLLSWKMAVQSMLQLKLLEIQDQVQDGGGEIEFIMQLIVEGGGAVGFSVVLERVFKGQQKTAKESIQALVKAKILHVRLCLSSMTYSDLAIERGNDIKYLMAINPAMFAAMKYLVTKP